MKDNPAAARKRMKRWRKANLKRAQKLSTAWKERNPTWYIGPSKIRLLTTALLNGNENSKVWHDAGMNMYEWLKRFTIYQSLGTLGNRSRLAPFRDWTHFVMTDGDQLREFLHPDNFQLIKK